jgi:hypothetical protein
MDNGRGNRRGAEVAEEGREKMDLGMKSNLRKMNQLRIRSVYRVQIFKQKVTKRTKDVSAPHSQILCQQDIEITLSK